MRLLVEWRRSKVSESAPIADNEILPTTFDSIEAGHNLATEKHPLPAPHTLAKFNFKPYANTPRNLCIP